MKTKKASKIAFILAVICAAALTLTACSPKKDDANASLKGKRVRVVIGSTSTGGDTYLTANTATRYLSEKIGFNGKVDAIGAARALQEITSAKPDGTTIMMFHDMTYLSVLFGAFGKEYALENFIVGPKMSIAVDSCFTARADAPYNNMAQMAGWLQANPGKTVKLAIEAGGVSQLVFNSYYDWVLEKFGKDVASRVKAFVSGSTVEKTQALWDGNCDALYGTISGLGQYVDDSVDPKIRMKVLGLTSAQRLPGKDYLTFAEQGITLDGKPFEFDKEYNMFFPKGTPQSIINEVDAAMAEIATDANYRQELEKLGFKSDYLSSKDNKAYMYAKRQKFAKIIEQAPSLDELTAQ